MRLSVSNLAWDVVEDDAVAKLLNAYGVSAIDVAPGKYFPDPLSATPEDIARVRNFWADRGVEIYALQALLFGADHLNIFGAPAVQDAVLTRLDAVCGVAVGLGARKLVFGSRANRDRSGLDDATAFDRAVAFFRRAASVVAGWELVMTLEAIPASFVNGEDPAEIIAAYAPLIAHVHLSDPGLMPPGDAGCDHASVAAALRRYRPELMATIEMLPQGNASRLADLHRALTFASQIYG